MLISAVPSNQEAITTSAVTWLTRVLDHPEICYSSFPNELKCFLYVDNIPKQLMFGTWQISDDIIYLPGRSTAVEPLTKLSILAAIAAMTKASQHPAIMEKITQKLITLLNEATRLVYGLIITSTQRPTRLAIDQEKLQVAVEINGSWLLTSGAPVEVTDKWITMEF